jgi:hypothetical protein
MHLNWPPLFELNQLLCRCCLSFSRIFWLFNHHSPCAGAFEINKVKKSNLHNQASFAENTYIPMLKPSLFGSTLPFVM